MSENTTAEELLRKEIGDSGGWKKGSLGAIEANTRVQQLEKRLNVDPLTGLESEYPLLDMINALQTRWDSDYKKGDYLKGTFVVIDMDYLHEINHKYGKSAGGDDFFRETAKALKDVSRGNGRCFRSGKNADEFILYLPGFRVRE